MRWGGFSSFFFLPPMTPSPPFGFLRGSFGWGGGEGCFGEGGMLGVRFWCRMGSGSASGSESDVVAWSVPSTGGCGEGLFFFVLDTGGAMAGFLDRSLR